MAPRNGECEGHIIPSSSSPFAAFVERRFSGSGGGTLAEFIGRIKSLTAARQSRRLQSDPCLMPAPISMIPNIWRSMAPSLLPTLLHPPLWPFLRDTGVSRQAARAEHRVNGTDFTSYCLCITGNTVSYEKLDESYFNNIVDDMPLFHEAKLPCLRGRHMLEDPNYRWRTPVVTYFLPSFLPLFSFFLYPGGTN